MNTTITSTTQSRNSVKISVSETIILSTAGFLSNLCDNNVQSSNFSEFSLINYNANQNGIFQEDSP